MKRVENGGGTASVPHTARIARTFRRVPRDDYTSEGNTSSKFFFLFFLFLRLRLLLLLFLLPLLLLLPRNVANTLNGNRFVRFVS